jgi:hypothetical protein
MAVRRRVVDPRYAAALETELAAHRAAGRRERAQAVEAELKRVRPAKPKPVEAEPEPPDEAPSIH